VGGYSVFFAVDTVLLKVSGGVFITLGLLTVSIIKTCRTV
jgi:hypothetical protein